MSPIMLNALLNTIGIAALLALPMWGGAIFFITILLIHCRILKSQEWRLLIQLSVIAWVVDAIFLRMNLLTFTGDIHSVNRIMCWTMLATTLCHANFPMMLSYWRAALLGALWGGLLYGLPLLVGYYQSSISPWQMVMVASTSCALVLVLFHFVIRTRIMPQHFLHS